MKYLMSSGHLYTPNGLNSRMYEHRQVAEKVLGRKLKRNECVHHINYDKTDNRHENLIICDISFHNTIHARTDTINAGFDPNLYQWCSHHKQYEHIDSFGVGNGYRNKSGICLQARKEKRKQK